MQKSPLTFSSLADLMGLAGLLFFGRCARTLLLHHQTRDAMAVLFILVIWMIGCLLVLRKHNRV